MSAQLLKPFRQRLILTAPAALSPERLTNAVHAGDVAAVVFAAPCQPELIACAQAAGAAALVEAETWDEARGADGLHIIEGANAAALLAARPGETMCGTAASDRHAAMLAGEAGSDYVWFDGTGDLTAACTHAQWWQSLFEVPVVVAGQSCPQALHEMMASRAEFIAMVDVFSDRVGGEADVVAQVNARLDEAGA
ncbi:MAG: thiamine phosphate synthase [Pseudomonadota bacterium]